MLNTEEMGKRIKELRIEKGWTGIKMSTKIGVDQSYYSKIEKGKHEIKLEKLYKIADIFNVSLDYLTARTNKKEITN
jgi:transcriptional regulator with XRE-family HTH domain